MSTPFLISVESESPSKSLLLPPPVVLLDGRPRDRQSAGCGDQDQVGELDLSHVQARGGQRGVSVRGSCYDGSHRHVILQQSLQQEVQEADRERDERVEVGQECYL